MTRMDSRLPDLVPRLRAVVSTWAAARDVDDITQECCLRLLEKEHLYRPERGKLTQWVDTVARRVTFGALGERRLESSMEPLEDPAAPEPDLSSDQVGWVLEQFARLTKRERQVLSLRYFENLSTPEIGKRLGISQPAVSKRLAKALARLRHRARVQGFLSAFLPIPLAQALAGASTLKKSLAGLTALVATSTCVSFFLPDPDTAIIANTRDLSNTTIVATLDDPFEPTNNTLWCATLPIAWKELERLTGGPLQAGGNSGVSRLSASGSRRTDVAPDGLVARAGRIDDGIVEAIQEALDERFGAGRDPILDLAAASLRPDDLLTYAFLARTLEFSPHFERLQDHQYFRQVIDGEEDWHEIVGFGIKEFDDQKETHKKLREIVDIIDWRDDEDFIVRIRPTDETEEVILAQVQPGATLRETVEGVTERTRNGPVEMLRNHDELSIPELDFHLTHRFPELLGAFVTTDGGSPYEIREVMVTIDFGLNERGAAIKSRAIVALEGDIKPEVKRLNFYGPFLVLLKRRDAERPYFAAWIAHPELLLAWEDAGE